MRWFRLPPRAQARRQRVMLRSAFAIKGLVAVLKSSDIPVIALRLSLQAAPRAVQELQDQSVVPKTVRLRSSKYLNNVIEQDHHNIKLRLGPMLGLKRFRSAAITIVGIDLMRCIHKGQFALAQLQVQGQVAPAVWEAALAA